LSRTSTIPLIDISPFLNGDDPGPRRESVTRGGRGGRQISMTFFHQPNYDAVVQWRPACADAARLPRCGTTTSGEHVRMKIDKQRQGDLAADRRLDWERGPPGSLAIPGSSGAPHSRPITWS